MASSGNAVFDRRCKLTIYNPVSTPTDFQNTTTDVIEIDGGSTDDIDTPGQRIKFNIKKTLKKEPNTCEITVTNLSPTTRASLQQKGVKVVLEAGYKQAGVFRVCRMDVRTIDHVRNGADWDTVMKLGDGERSWRFSKIYESFASGTSVSDAIKTIARATGLGIGNVSDALSSETKVLDQGYAVAGSAAKALDKLVTSIGKNWSIQDGELQLLDPDEALPASGDIPELSPSSGLIGSPEMGSPPKKGKPALVKLKALLFSTKPGARVKMNSSRYPKGVVKVESCTFEGDTHGGEWYTSIDGTIIP